MGKREFNWFYKTENIKKCKLTFSIILLVSVSLEFFIERHGHFKWETIFGNRAIFGFVACAGLIFLSKLLGLWLKKKEDYYE